MFPFRVEHFLPQASYFTWYHLPPILVQIRALRMRLEFVLPRPFTTETIAQCREAWHALSQTGGKYRHYLPYPFLTPDRLASPAMDGLRDPLSSGGDVTMMSGFFDHVEAFTLDRDEKSENAREDAPFAERLAHLMANLEEPCAVTAAGLAAAMAWLKLADAEEILLSRKTPDRGTPLAGGDGPVEAAWLCVQEATVLINQTKYLRLIGGPGFSQLPVPEGVLRGLFFYDGAQVVIDLRAHQNDVREPEERFAITVGETGTIDGFRLWSILLAATPAVVDWGLLDIPYTRNAFEFIIPKPLIALADFDAYKKEGIGRHPTVPPDPAASTRAVGEALRQALATIREKSELAASLLQYGLSIHSGHKAQYQSDRVIWTVPYIHGNRR